MKRILYFMGCLLILTTSVYAVEVSVAPVYWDPDFEADARIRKNNIGDTIDFQDDLGIDDESIPGVNIDLKLGKSNHFLFSYWTVGYDGKNTLTRAFDFNGETYALSTMVTSAFDMDVFGVGYVFDLLKFESFHVGPMLKVNYYAVETELKTNDPAIPLANEDKLDLVFPFVGVRFGINLWDDKLKLNGEFAGLWWQSSGFWDGSVELAYYPLEELAISAGYRSIHLDIDDDDDRANLKLDGPTVMLNYRF